MSPQLPLGHTAVMAHREATEVDDLDYFPTPPWAARACGALVRRIDPGARSCWEPAAGGGHMAHGLADIFDQVELSDIHDYGLEGCQVLDFLSHGALDVAPGVDWVISNPPFKHGEAFVRQGLRFARRGVAMLLRLQFKESGGRYRLLHDDGTRIAVAAPFAERVPMVKGRWDPEAASATAYCLFVFLKEAGLAASPMREAIEACWAHTGYLELTIPPGQKEAWSRASDYDRFVEQAPTLFGAHGVRGAA